MLENHFDIQVETRIEKPGSGMRMAKSESNLVGLSSDADDDEALRFAIALSLQQQRSPGATEGNSGQSTAFGSIHLDRKTMEEDRLKRQAVKRPRPLSDDDVVQVSPPRKKIAATPSYKETRERKLVYPHGAVKRTWAYGYPRTTEDIKIEEVFQKDQLEMAILSSYQWDEDWLMSKLDMRMTKMLLVAYAADESQKEAMRANTPSNIRFCFPKMQGFGAMHSKLQVLKYPESLRIVIPTGNLVPYDWGETGVMENMVFLIDLPRLSDGNTQIPTVFGKEMSRFLQESGVDEKMITSLSHYDFSQTEQLKFIHTIPGSHMDECRRYTGYCGLGSAVGALGLATSAAVEVDIVASSLGSINSDLIDAVYNGCQGDIGMKEYQARISRKPAASKSRGISHVPKEHTRIHFPTEKTVTKSRGGRGAAGTICLQSKWWQAPGFPRELIRDCVNTREGLLMHSKAIYIRRTDLVEGERPLDEPLGCAYVGSANLSESAWGRLVKDKTTGKPKMSCRNWECGVLIPLLIGSVGGRNSSVTHGTERGAVSMDAFRHGRIPIPVPMQLPGRHYEPDGAPWFYSESS